MSFVSSFHSSVQWFLTLSLICLLWRMPVNVVSVAVGTQNISVLICFAATKQKCAKMCIVASEWISMLTVITGNQQFVATLMKQQTAVWCLTPGCRRICNEAFGLLLKRKIFFFFLKLRDKMTLCDSFHLPADLNHTLWFTC